MSDCLFCKIVNGDIPGDIVYQTDDVLAFKDLSPQAPVHTLVIPKKHISTINDFQEDDAVLIGHLFLAAKAVAKQEGMDETGYRCVMNCNDEGGQTVHHIHLHVLGKRQMNWPPG